MTSTTRNLHAPARPRTGVASFALAAVAAAVVAVTSALMAAPTAHAGDPPAPVPPAKPHAAKPRPTKARPGRASWAPDLARRIVPTRVERLGNQLATWYGPGLFGNGTACGQRLTPDTFGIAHRTLPCGTLVHLGYKGRRIAVRVIDRGPFSGATVDLTSRTKYFLRFTSGNVRMSIVKRFRRLPMPVHP
jgi:rare lipoprotein A (peptidoglycan hydrolase)